jgi:hypothetical protein
LTERCVEQTLLTDGRDQMDHAFAEQFAEEWYAAWNAHDPERILSHYADDVEVASPLVSVLTGEADGRISGRMRCAPTSPRAARPPRAVGLAEVRRGLRRLRRALVNTGD